MKCIKGHTQEELKEICENKTCEECPCDTCEYRGKLCGAECIEE